MVPYKSNDKSVGFKLPKLKTEHQTERKSIAVGKQQSDQPQFSKLDTLTALAMRVSIKKHNTVVEGEGETRDFLSDSDDETDNKDHLNKLNENL